MGLLTLEEFRDELRLALRQRTDLTDDQLNRWINQAYLHLCAPEVRRHKEIDVDQEITLVAGQNVYNIDQTTLGYNLIAITEVTYYDGNVVNNTTDRHDVAPRDLHWFNRRRIPSSGGGPRQYLWRGTTVTFSPIPTAAEAGNKVVVSGLREPAPLVAGSRTVLASYWDRALVLGARWIAQDSLDLGETAIASQQKYSLYINERLEGSHFQGEDTEFEQEIKNEPYQPGI